MAKYVIFNADDAGAKPDITAGIVDSFYNGVLRSATVLINHIHPGDITLLKNAVGLGLGLHTNLISGEPVSDSWKSTYGNFAFTDPSSNRKNYTDVYTQSSWNEMFAEYEIGIIIQELEAQVEKFEAVFGVFPTHLDSHYNTYSVEKVWQSYMVVAQKYGLPVRLPAKYHDTESELKESELTLATDRVEELQELGILTTEDMYLEYLNLQPDYIQAILDKMEKLEDEAILEIPVHPGYTTITREEWKKRYVDILTDENLAKALETNNIKTISYAELPDIRNA